MSTSSTLEAFQWDAAPKSEIAKHKESIRGLVQDYEVKKWDTADSIARKFWLVSFDDLVALNRFLDSDVRIEKRGRRTHVPLKEGQVLQVPIPEHREKFDGELSAIREYSKIREQNRKVVGWSINLFKEDVEERIFWRSPLTLDHKEFFQGFIEGQKRDMDPKLPPIIDEKHRKDVACIHMLRRLDFLRVNDRDRSPGERAYVRKWDVHAWMVQDHLEKIGYKRLFHSLAETTDPVLAKSAGVPVDKSRRDEYDAIVRELESYLSTQGKPGSYMSVSYRYSDYRDMWGREHPNTHQMMFVGTDSIEFPAYKFPDVKGGKVVDFSDDHATLRKRLLALQDALPEKKAAIKNKAEELFSLLDTAKNPKLEYTRAQIRWVIERRVAEFPTQEKKAVAREELFKAFEIGSEDAIMDVHAKLYKRPREVFQNDARFIVSLLRQEDRIVKGVEEVKKRLSKKDTPEPELFPIEELGMVVSSNPIVSAALREYNMRVEAFLKGKQEVEGLKESMEVLVKNRKIEESESKSRIARAEAMIPKLKEALEWAKSLLSDAIDSEKNQKLSQSLAFLSTRIQVVAGPKAPLVEKALESWDMAELARLVKKQADLDYFVALHNSRKKALASIAKIRSHIHGGSEYSKIDTAKLWTVLSSNEAVKRAVEEFNSRVSAHDTVTGEIASATEILKKKKTLSAVEFFANFVAARADTKTHLTAEWRSIIYDGIKRFPSFIKMKVNGTEVDMAAELSKAEKDRVKISPEDTVTISGPMMLDGFHRLERSGERNPKMDARIRFFSEALISWLMFPTELHEPTEKSVYWRSVAEWYGSKLKVSGMYSLWPKDELGKILRERIVSEFERDAFEKLSEKYPDRHSDSEQAQKYSAEKTNLIRVFYKRQIQALQLAGYLESEDKQNPLANYANRPIPYFDTSGEDFKKMYADHVTDKKTKSLERGRVLAEQREFVSLRVFPGDTLASIFSRISEFSRNAAEHHPEFSRLAMLSTFDSPMRSTFLRAFFREFFEMYGWKHAKAYSFWSDTSKMDKEQVLDAFMEGKIKVGSEFVLPYGKMSEIIAATEKVYEFREIKVKPLDEAVIHMIGGNDRMRWLLKAVLVRETYIPEWSIGKRRFSKGVGESLGKTSSLSDFQIKFLGGSLAKWKQWSGVEWPKPEDFKEIFRVIDWDSFKRTAEVFGVSKTPEYAEDMQRMERIRPIVEKAVVWPISDEDLAVLRKELEPVLRMDDGRWLNLVGKFLAGILTRENLMLHSQKIEWVLVKAGHDMNQVVSTANWRDEFTEMLLLTNNLWNKDAFFFWVVENYMIRLLNALELVEGSGKIYRSKDIRTSLKWWLVDLWQKELGTGVFVEHMEHLADLIASNHDSIMRNNRIRLDQGNQAILDDAQKMSETNDRMKVRNAIFHATVAMQEVVKSQKFSGLALDAELAKIAFALFRDPELKSALNRISKEPGLRPEVASVLLDDVLPREEERKGVLWAYNRKSRDKAEPGKQDGYLEFWLKYVKDKFQNG